MPKRSLNLHENIIESEENDNENIDFTIKDYLENPKTKDIILNQHFFDFEYGLGQTLATMYRKHAYLFSEQLYLNDKKMFNDQLFLNFIYHHIYKDYNTDFIKNNDFLQNIVLKDFNKPNNNKKKTIIETNLNTNSKIFDWATKTYK